MPPRAAALPPPPWAVGEPGDSSAHDREPDPHDWARQIVLRLLTNAPKTRSQLHQALLRRNCPEEVADAVLDRMEQVGLVDDAAYAAMYVHSQQAGKGLARRGLAYGLRRKGLDDDLVQEVLDRVDPRAEEELARGLVERRLARLHGLPRDVQVRRLAGMLARKGYGAEVSRRVIREVLDEAPEHLRD